LWQQRVDDVISDLADDDEELLFGEEDWLGDSIDELLDGSPNARDLSRLRLAGPRFRSVVPVACWVNQEVPSGAGFTYRTMNPV
jgi:hypothetical protein